MGLDEIPNTAPKEYWKRQVVGDTPAEVHVIPPKPASTPYHMLSNKDHDYPTPFPTNPPKGVPQAPPPVKVVREIPAKMQVFGDTYKDYSRPGNTMAVNPGHGLPTRKYRSLHVNYDGMYQG